MFRILIVDDEHYVVDSLAELILKTWPDFDVLTTCYSDEALHILEQYKIDILFLDIKMPGMSGIDIAKEIVINWPNCRIIFFTGHARFDYIYEINSLRNSTFLLKTESNETILSTLKKAITNLEEAQQYHLLLSESEQLQLRITYLLNSDILHDFLKGKSLSDIQPSKNWTDTQFPFNTQLPLYLIYMNIKWNTPSESLTEFHQKILEFTAWLKQNLNKKYQLSLIDTNTNTFLLFLQPISNMQLRMNLNHETYIRECLNECVSSTLPHSAKRLIILNNQRSISWQQIPSAYEFYEQYYTQFIQPSFYQESCMIFCEEKHMTKHEATFFHSQIPIPHNAISDLTEHLQTWNLTEVQKTLSLLQTYFLQINSMHQLSAIQLFHKISNIFIDFILQYQLSEKVAFKIGLYKLYSLDQFSSWKDLFSYYQDLSVILLQSTNEEAVTQHTKTIIQIKKYIHDNIHRSLSLNEIANAVNYNSTYVSKLFHRVTNENLSQYILRTKMDKAINYLISSNESIQNISEKLGFENSQYFSIIFKKYTGLSPRDYRKSSLHINQEG